MRSVNFICSGNENPESLISAEGLQPEKEYFIRVHTCIHTRDNVMPFVEAILACLPKSRIIGCSTSGVVCGGEIRSDCCLISVTEFSCSSVRTELVGLTDTVGAEIRGSILADRTVGSVITASSKYMFAFFACPFMKISSFIERINEASRKIQIIGGIANTPVKPFINLEKKSFVFDNNGASCDALAVAVVDSDSLSVYSDMMYVTEPVGISHTITDADGMIIRTIDGENAVEWYKKQLGITVSDIIDDDMTTLFPLIKSDNGDLPWALSYSPQNEKRRVFPDEPEPVMFVPSEARTGERVRIAYSSVQKNIEVCEDVCNKISEHPAEVLFGYICVSHKDLFSNCAEWEIRPFRNTNMSGCFVIGEIGSTQNTNRYCNYSFAVSALSESNRRIRINADMLRESSADLINSQEHIVNYLLKFSRQDADESLLSHRYEIEETLFKDDDTGIDNITKFSYDLSMGRFDKICMITFRNEGLLNAFLSKSKFQSCLNRFYRRVIEFIDNSSFNCYVYKKNSLIITASPDLCDGEFIDIMHSVQEFVSEFKFYSYVPVTEFSIVMHEEDMINKAELALVSMRSKNIFFLQYTSDLGLEQIHARKMKMLMILNDAVTNDRVVPFFQGIRDNKTGKIGMYESLMRIRDSEGNIYVPYRFMDIAKEYGFYPDISYMMISKVMKQFRDRQDIVTINLNISDIYDYKIVHFILDFLRIAPRPQNYVFELTETEEIEDYQIIAEFVERIHQAGGKIAIDDFGSGFSNIVNIFKVKSDYIKIDGEIVKNIKNDVFAREFLEMIAGWAEKHHKEIIAEFIENSDIQALIEENSIRYSQGYLFSKPSDTLQSD
ncbi:MAG: EAL domain-containing protein [Ruminococcus flavefaciens]|nr:EAL domain-containing protein [Ruminococcus flavefaciens]MCM1231416.1 EAL domain-containing protein [Ruminococcus flavefaciens]